VCASAPVCTAVGAAEGAAAGGGEDKEMPTTVGTRVGVAWPDCGSDLGCASFAPMPAPETKLKPLLCTSARYHLNSAWIFCPLTLSRGSCDRSLSCGAESCEARRASWSACSSATAAEVENESESDEDGDEERCWRILRSSCMAAASAVLDCSMRSTCTMHVCA
jgi:hypothetical protein